jgi:hypothetical protein
MDVNWSARIRIYIISREEPEGNEQPPVIAPEEPPTAPGTPAIAEALPVPVPAEAAQPGNLGYLTVVGQAVRNAAYEVLGQIVIEGLWAAIALVWR